MYQRGAAKRKGKAAGSSRMRRVMCVQRSSRLAGMLPRVGGGDDLAHAGLVEPLEPVVALEVLQVPAERAVGAELRRLVGRDAAGGEQPLDPLGAHRPPLAFRERLAQVREVGER